MGIVADAQIELAWPTQQHVPVGGHYAVYGDEGDGSIDYAAPLNPAPIDAWPDGAGKAGWGLGRWGRGGWGHGEGGLGWGQGRWGFGFFGLGADMLRHVIGPLTDGRQRLAVIGFDKAGNPAAPAAGALAELVIAGTPAAPGELTASAYDDGMDTLTLEWELSGDDEG